MDATAKLVLVVDDSDDLRETISELLAEMGYIVSVAKSAEDALAWLRRGHRPSLLITDHRLPGQSGLWLVTELRRSPDLEGVPAILISGGTMPGQLQGVERLSKPFGIDALMEVVERLCREGPRADHPR